MIRQRAALLLVVIGVALIAVGASWKWLYPRETYWSPDKAKQYQDAFNAVHAVEDSHGAYGEVPPEFIAARQRYDQMKNELEQARNSRDRTGPYLSLAGFALLLAAAVFRHFWPASAD